MADLDYGGSLQIPDSRVLLRIRSQLFADHGLRPELLRPVWHNLLISARQSNPLGCGASSLRLHDIRRQGLRPTSATISRKKESHRAG